MNRNNLKNMFAVLCAALILFGCIELPSDKGLTFGAINIPESPSDLGETCKLQAGQEEPWVISDNQVCTGGYIEMNGQTIRITETGSLTLNGVSIDMDGGAIEIFGDLNISQTSMISGGSYIFYVHDGSNVFIDNSQILNAGSTQTGYLPHQGIYVEGSSTTLEITNSIINSGNANYGLIIKEVQDIYIYNTDFSNFNEAAIYTISTSGTIQNNQITGGKYGIFAVYFKNFENYYDLIITENNIYGSATAIYIDPPQCGDGKCDTSMCEGDQQLDCSVLNETECNENVNFGCRLEEVGTCSVGQFKTKQDCEKNNAIWTTEGIECAGGMIECSYFSNAQESCESFGCIFYEKETSDNCPADCASSCTLDTQACPYEGCQYTDGKGKCFSTVNCEICNERICNDVIDNDGDGLVDCEDPDCSKDPECISDCTEYFECPESCYPCWTNDNGATLFTDQNCNAVCPSPVVCGDGRIEGNEQCEQNVDCINLGETYICENCICVEPQLQLPTCSGTPVDLCIDIKGLNDPSKECDGHYEISNGYHKCVFNGQIGCMVGEQCTYEQPQEPVEYECVGNAILCQQIKDEQLCEMQKDCLWDKDKNICYGQTINCPQLTDEQACQMQKHCVWQEVVIEEPQEPEEICNDGIDNNEDGLTDCADSLCGNFQECLVLRESQNSIPGLLSLNIEISSNTISNANTGISFVRFQGVNAQVDIISNTICDGVGKAFEQAQQYNFESNICDYGELYCSETCPVEEIICGDGKCEGDENQDNCPQDCGEPEQPKTWELTEQCINTIYESSKFNLNECGNDQQCIQLIKDNMETEIINCKGQYATENIYKPENQIMCGDGICNYPQENSKVCPQDCKEKVTTTVALVDQNGLRKYEQQEINYDTAIEEKSQTGQITLTISEENKVCTPNELCEIAFIIGNQREVATHTKLRLEVDANDANIINSLDMKTYGLNSGGSATKQDINTKEVDSTNTLGKIYYDFGGTDAVTGILVPARSSILVNFEVLPKNGVFKYSVYLDSEQGDQIYIDPWVISPPIYVNENYILETDLDVNGTLFIINASDVTLDCAGHTITGNGTGYGVYNEGFDNVTVENCVINNFNRGIYFANSADYGLIQNNTATLNSYGFRFYQSSFNTLTNNTATLNNFGFWIVTNSNNNSFRNNIVNENDGNGIFLFSSSFNTFTNNTVCSNGIIDIEILDSSGNSGDNTCDILENNSNPVTCTEVCSVCTPISIPDSGLLNAVCSALGEDPGCTVTDCDALTLTELWAGSREISDLTGLEYFTNLNTLILGNNQISDISALSTLTNLQQLYLNNNQISDISALSTLTNLNSLNLGDNKISDISALSTLTNLQGLYLGANQISDISALSTLTNLQQLILRNNQISDISALSTLTNLTYLELGSNQISDISALSTLTNLQTLSLWGNQISDISALSDLTNLNWLYLNNNQISDISALSPLSNLTYLSLSGNKISDISALSTLTNLQQLYLYNNQISDISALSTLTNLQQLYLYNNQISDISALSTLTNLNYLDLNNNQISNISTLSTLSNLNWLYLRDNQISTNPLCPASAEQNATYETLEGYGCSINWDSQSEAICDDACDNDEDGLVDCDDSDCDEDEACEEECTPISIPDSGLLNAVCSALGEDPGCTVTDCDALTLTELWAKDREISDLTGIEYFTNLNTLILGNNQISNISALSTLSNLNFLYLYSNQISDISALSTLTNLQGLSLWDNQISDISALSTLTNLNTLELGGNKISDISALSGLSNLTKLYLGSNQISINPECPASAVQLSIKAVLEVLGCYVDWSSQSEAICDDGCDNDEDRLVDCDDSDCDEDKAPLECAFTALCPDCEVCAGEPMGCDKFGATPEECNVQLGCELVQESVCILGVDCGSYGEESACTKGGCCDWVDVKGQWQCTQNFDCSIYQNGQQCSGNPCCLWTLGSPVCSGTPVACEDRAKEECILGCLVGGYTDDESVTCYSDNECSVSCEVEEEVVCEDNSVCKIVACDSGENCDEFIFEDACGNGTCSDEEYDITMYCGVNTNRLQCSEYAINNLIYAHGDGVCVLLYHNQVGMNSNEFLNYCDFIGGEREIPKEGESLTATICDCETEELVCDGYRICNAGQGPNEQFCGSGTCGGIEYEVNSYCQLFVDSLEECAEAVLNPNVMTAYPYYSDGNCMIANYEGSGADESQFQQDCALMGATTSPVPLSATMTACDCSVDCSDPANIDKLECCFDPTDNSTFYNRVSVVNNILYLIQSVRLCEGDFYLPAHDDWYYNSYGQPTPPNGEGFAIIMSAEDVILYGPQSGPAVMRGNNTGVGIWMHGSNNIIDGNNNLIIQDYSTAILAESIISNPFEYNIKNLIINDVAKGIHIRPNLLLMQQSQVTYGNIQNVNIDGTCGTGIKFEQASFNNELFGLTKGTIENCEMECNQPYTGFNADVRNVILIAKDSLEVLNGNDALMTTKRKDENVGIEGNLQYNSVNIKIDPAQKAQYEQGKILKFEEPVDFIRGDSGNSLSIKEKETGVYGIAWKSDLINISKNLPMNAVNFDNKFISLDSQEILEYIEEKTIEVTLELTSDMECSKAIVYKSSSHVENREAILTDINKEAVIRNGQSTVDYITVTSCVDPVLFDPQGNDIINGYIVFEVMNGQWSSYTVAQEGVPEIISIEITPQEPTKDDDLVCTAIAVSDEVDELNVTFTWTEEGAPFSISENTISCESGEECTDTLSSDETYSDQVWTCTVIAFDGEEYSSEESDTVTIHMGELPDEICDDGIDNDGDGLVDCEDPDCDNETCDIGKVCINYECISPTSPSRPSPTPSNPNLEIDTIGEYCVGEEITFIITDEYSDLISTAKIEESKVKLGTLGYTNSIGEFRYIFENTGNYRIDVYKSRYNPAYQYISVSDCTGYCTSNNDCLTGYYCDGTQCVELECLPGFTVSGHSCVAPKECQTDSNCKHDQYCSDEGYCEIVECDCGYIADHQCNEYECCSDIDCKVPIELCVNNVCTPVSDDIIEQTEGSKEDSAIERFEKKLLNIKSKLGELYILIEEAKITGQNIDEMQELLEQARAYVLQGDFENAELTIQKAKFQVEGEDKDTRIVYLALLIIVLLISMMVWHNKTKAANHIKTKNTKKKTRKKR